MNLSRDPFLVVHNQIENLIYRSGNEIYDELFRLEQENTNNTPVSQTFIDKLEIKKISNELDLTCSICCEKMIQNDEFIELECDHSFHNSCLKKWLEIDNTCPICRKILDINPAEEFKIIYLTIYFPNRSILYKSFPDNMTFHDFINKVKNYLPDNYIDKLILIKNKNNKQENNFDNESNLTLKELNFSNGSKINFIY